MKDYKQYYERINFLHEKYFHLFETYKRNENEQPIICRGIEVPYGWLDLTEKLLESLDWHTKHNLPFDGINSIKIFQIKEKFGSLRCYATCNSVNLQNSVDQTISFYEGVASLTCESCGVLTKEGNKNVNGWLSVKCEDCRNKKEKL